MDKVTLQKWLLDNLITVRGHLNASRVKKSWFDTHGCSEHYNCILKFTKFLDKSEDILSERIYCLLNDITEIPKCRVCNSFCKFKQFSFGYRVYCSRKCSIADSKNRLAKTSQTVFDRYGVRNYRQLPECSERIKSTSLHKYGKKHTLHLDHVKQARESASLLKFGTLNPFNSELFQKEMRENYFTKYGVYHHTHKKINKQVLDKLFDKKWLIQEHHVNKKSQTQIGNDLGVHPNTVRRYLINHDIEIQYHEDCSFSSKAESDILEHINTFYTGKVCRRDRTVLPNNRELDFYFPEKNFAIEYNGLYWHSTAHESNPNYHLEKTLDCKSRCISLLHIFSYEWENPVTKEVLKSMISNRLGFTLQKIYARNTQIKQVSLLEAKTFINENHLQPLKNNIGKIRLGLFSKSGDLVSLMTFGKPRFRSKTKYDYELIRFCTLRNSLVVGGASKLLTFFEKTYCPLNVVTFANLRYSDGGLYTNLGFSKVRRSKPNYVYTSDFIEVLPKNKFRRKFLPDLFGDQFDQNLSEVENCRNNGWYQVFDCGTETYVKTYKPKERLICRK